MGGGQGDVGEVVFGPPEGEESDADVEEWDDEEGGG